MPVIPTELFGSPVGKSHDRIAVLQDGRVIAMGKCYTYGDTTFSTGCEYVNVRVPDLRMIEYVLNVQFHLDPASMVQCDDPIYEAVNKKIVGNVVGMTVMGKANADGGTLIVEVIAIGPP